MVVLINKSKLQQKENIWAIRWVKHFKDRQTDILPTDGSCKLVHFLMAIPKNVNCAFSDPIDPFLAIPMEVSKIYV